MKHSTTGRPRKYTDAQVKAVRAWKPLKDFCRDLGISYQAADYLRHKRHKKAAP